VFDDPIDGRENDDMLVGEASEKTLERETVAEERD